ncbi:MAG: FtsQ-type POTRA domain-containing protein [Deltaproteobacteria bacterium]|nr:FtsQ-type POTRA domain-containing protein [Deltaproteobacteria bacterium]
MKQRVALKRQAVSRKTGRKKGKAPSKMRYISSFIGSCFLKVVFFITVGVAVSMAFLFLYEYLLRSPYIRLEKVVFKGIDYELKDELMKRANLDFNLSLLAINLRDVKSNLETHPWVRDVEVEKRFPHTLVIKVEKEVPWAIVAAGKLYYMDRGGHIFKEVTDSDNLDFPVLTGISLSGQGMEDRLREAVNVLHVFEKEEDPWSLENLSEVHIEENGEVSLYFLFLPAVIQSRVEDLPEKMGDLRRLVEHLNNSGRIHMVKSINLNYREGAAVAFRKS